MVKHHSSKVATRVRFSHTALHNYKGGSMSFISSNADKKSKDGKCYVKGCGNDAIKTIQFLKIKRKVCKTHENRHKPIKKK